METDLDRKIWFQKPDFVRTYGPEIGVSVTAVLKDGRAVDGHHLLGAPVELVGNPVFEGRNGVISEDGFEPVLPFDLQVSKDAFELQRSLSATDPLYPFEGNLAGGVDASARAAQAITAATGMSQGLRPVWTERLEQLRKEVG